MTLEDLKDDVLIDSIDALVTKRAKMLNDHINEFNKKMEPYTYQPLTQEARNFTEKYRIGLCFEATQDIFEFIKSLKKYNTDDFTIEQAATSSGPYADYHFYLRRGNDIIDATYKQFLYKPFITMDEGKIKIDQTKMNKIDKLPNVFLGTSEELQKIVSDTLRELGATEKIIHDASQNWEKKVTRSFKP